MSTDATRWAWKADLKPASLKLVLLSLADRADETHCCFPSASRLSDDTGLDLKTVKSNLRKLSEAGVIEDTGRRKGRTRSVKVWRLMGVVGRHDNDTSEEIHTIRARASNEADPKTVRVSDTENGTTKPTQKRTVSDTENGTTKPTQKRDAEPISRNLKEEPPPKPPQNERVGVEGMNIHFTNGFPERVLEIFNIEAAKPGNSNWCEQSKLTLNDTLGIRYLYDHHDMDNLFLWEMYFSRLADTKYVKSMRGVSLRFVVKEDSIINCESGMYDRIAVGQKL